MPPNITARRVHLLVTSLPTCTTKGEVAIINDVVTKHKPTVSRLQHLIEAMQPQGVQCVRKQEEGDELDLNLDPRADQNVSRIFGVRNNMVVDHLQSLPEKLPLHYKGSSNTYRIAG